MMQLVQSAGLIETDNVQRFGMLVRQSNGQGRATDGRPRTKNQSCIGVEDIPFCALEYRVESVSLADTFPESDHLQNGVRADTTLRARCQAPLLRQAPLGLRLFVRR